MPEPKTKLSWGEHNEQFMKKHNCKSVRGLSIRNATGDFDQTSLGFEYALTSLTYIIKEVLKQSFYEIPFADYVPVVVGEGSFAQALLQNAAISSGGAFEEGDINDGGGNSRMASADAGVTPITRIVKNWAKATNFTLIEVEQALMAMNWDVIQARHEARKENWDLGLQKVAFLGHKTDTRVLGLLTQSNVNSNTALITAPISNLSAADFQTFVAGLIAAYQSNCAYTRMPDTFVMPQSDLVGMAAPVSSAYPMISKLEYLQKALDQVCGNKVAIKGCVYSQAAYNTAYGVNKARYALYRNDVRSIRMDIPVDLTTTQPNTVNNFQFQDAAYGQYTGVKAMRPLELLYFDY